MSSGTTETAITIGKWASVLNHLRQNRIEYLLMLGLMHLLGITTKAYSHVEGVCI